MIRSIVRQTAKNRSITGSLKLGQGLPSPCFLTTQHCHYSSTLAELPAKQKNKLQKNKSKPSSITHQTEALDFANRKQSLLESSRDLYPLLSSSTPTDSLRIRIPDFRAQWESKATHEEPSDYLLTVQGRVRRIRKSGKGLMFMDVYQDSTKLQVIVNRQKANMPEDVYESEHSILRRGDIVSVTGRPWKTKTGELSLLADRPATLLAPCLHPIPTNLKNETTRRHNRVVDLLANEDARNVLFVRAAVLGYIREFFVKKGFLEVQTPMLADMAGGAAATPFTTHSKVLGNISQDSQSAPDPFGDAINTTDQGSKPKELSLRIAPELWLKRLVVTGFDKVFELGQCFRNEGIDATHNPEFTTCEFYQAYATLDDLIELTSELLLGIVTRVQEQHPNLYTDRIAELKSAFQLENIRKVDFVEEIEKRTNANLEKKLNKEGKQFEYVKFPTDCSNIDQLVEFCKKVGAPLPDTITSSAKLLDHLCGLFIEPLSEGTFKPLLIMNHPVDMSPLSKSNFNLASTNSQKNTPDGSTRNLSRRFELFISGKEYVNAYEEENSPFEQAYKFQMQLKDREELFDEEANLPDASYVEALEWGLPPTGGWGMGVDRLTMLITDSKRIESVLTFGGIKSVNYQ